VRCVLLSIGKGPWSYTILADKVCHPKLHITYIITFSDSAAQRGLWPPRSRDFVITHNDAPQSVGLLWTSDQLVAETFT
jgi:hypothetical protein